MPNTDVPAAATGSPKTDHLLAAIDSLGTARDLVLCAVLAAQSIDGCDPIAAVLNLTGDTLEKSEGHLMVLCGQAALNAAGGANG